MVVGELSKPKSMDLNLPQRYCDQELTGITNCGAGTVHRLITVLLDENDKIIMYYGFLDFPFSSQTPKRIEYGKKGIRNKLQIIKRQIAEFYGSYQKSPIVIIKPSKKCNFKNLVDILDEMAIAQIGTYAIVNEFSPEESILLASN